MMPVKECNRRSTNDAPCPARSGATPCANTGAEELADATEAPYEFSNEKGTFYYRVPEEVKSRNVRKVLEQSLVVIPTKGAFCHRIPNPATNREFSLYPVAVRLRDFFSSRSASATNLVGQANVGSMETAAFAPAKDQHLVPDLQPHWPKTVAVPV
jgi:hypothetical protein